MLNINQLVLDVVCVIYKNIVSMDCILRPDQERFDFFGVVFICGFSRGLFGIFRVEMMVDIR